MGLHGYVATVQAIIRPVPPNARLVIDKFHVVKDGLRSALDEERKKYQATLSKEERVHVKKSIRWLTLKRPGSLNAAN
jgi:transposase